MDRYMAYYFELCRVKKGVVCSINAASIARGWRWTERQSEDEPQIGRMAEFLTQT